MPTTDELTVSVTMRGLARPQAAERTVIAMLKRSLYLVDGIPGEFGARIDAPSGAIELDASLEWQRARDSNPRGCDPNPVSGRAP